MPLLRSFVNTINQLCYNNVIPAGFCCAMNNHDKSDTNFFCHSTNCKTVLLQNFLSCSNQSFKMIAEPVRLCNNHLLIIIFPLLLILIACNKEQRHKQFVIGFSQCVESDAWRKTMLEEMKRELSFHPNITFIVKDADGNSERQISQVKEFLNQDIDLLIISPNEAAP